MSALNGQSKRKREPRVRDATPEEVEKFNRAVKAFAARQSAPTESDADFHAERAGFRELRGRL